MESRQVFIPNLQLWRERPAVSQRCGWRPTSRLPTCGRRWRGLWRRSPSLRLRRRPSLGGPEWAPGHLLLYKDSRDNGDFDDMCCVGLGREKKYQVSGWAAFTGPVLVLIELA